LANHFKRHKNSPQSSSQKIDLPFELYPPISISSLNQGSSRLPDSFHPASSFQCTTNLIAASACQMRLVAIISSKINLEISQISARSRRKKAHQSGLFAKANQRLNRCNGLFQGQYPSRQFMRFGIIDLRIGGHRHSAPHAGATFENFGGQFVNGSFVTRVFASDFFVGWADEFFVYGVAGHAVFGGGQGLVGKGGGGQGQHGGGQCGGKQFGQ
jgi:hypothetical protein